MRRVADLLADYLGLVGCYLVLVLCGWANDHFLLEQTEPAS